MTGREAVMKGKPRRPAGTGTGAANDENREMLKEICAAAVHNISLKVRLHPSPPPLSPYHVAA